jgi:hypothetical protein
LQVNAVTEKLAASTAEERKMQNFIGHDQEKAMIHEAKHAKVHKNPLLARYSNFFGRRGPSILGGYTHADVGVHKKGSYWRTRLLTNTMTFIANAFMAAH